MARFFETESKNERETRIDEMKLGRELLARVSDLTTMTPEEFMISSEQQHNRNNRRS